MSHTKGKLEVGDGSEYQAKTMIYIDDSLGSAIASCFMSHALVISREEMEANARRLAACWNVCNGLSTEALELMPTTLNQVFSLVNTTQERDKLLKKLHDMAEQIKRCDYTQARSDALEVLSRYPEGKS